MYIACIDVITLPTDVAAWRTELKYYTLVIICGTRYKRILSL